MAEQVLAWERMREKRKEGDRNQAKQRLMEIGKKKKKNQPSIKERSCCLSILAHLQEYCTRMG